MSEQLKASLVRIFLKEQDIAVGVGFLVPDKHVLTCAHVVIQALSLKDISCIPEINFSLDFPFIAPGNLFKAHVACWLPNNEDDIAVLELEVYPPATAYPVRLVTAQEPWGHPFRAFGFPIDYDKGVWASGVLRQGQVGGWLQIEAINVPGHRVVQGFSGTPVWDEQLDGVVGMVVESDTQASVKAAYIIPTALLIKAWPDLGPQAIPPCPYRGLSAFREIDAPYFFGREAYIGQLVEAVQKKFLVTLIGPSGSGKSSVVFAGLVPRLRQGENWLIAFFRPGDQPFRALATALIPLLEAQMSETDRLVEIKKLAERFQQGELSLRDVAERLVQKHFDTRLLLIADQFEELYTLCPSIEEREKFLDLLLATGQPTFQQRTSKFNMVIILRADFFGHALSYRPFADALQHTDVKLGPMTRRELQDAVRKPAEKLNIQIEDGLVERILGTVGREAGYLPLLEFALTLLWKRQRDRKLSLAAYDEIGGVERSLATYAEEIYTELSEKEQKRAQEIFIQLVHPGEGTEDTRRLATMVEVGEKNWDLVTHLSNARLVVSGRSEATGMETIEIVHEALIKGWRRLSEWMEADREFRMWQERVRAALRQWETNGQDDGLLFRGTLLVEAMGWVGQRREAISLAEKKFIQASHERQKEEEERWKKLYQEAEKQRHLLERTIGSMTEGMLVTDQHGVITSLNHSTQQLFNQAQIDLSLGQPISVRELANDGQFSWLTELADLIDYALEGNIILNHELNAGISGDTIPLTLNVSAAPLSESSQAPTQPVGVVTILSDITSSKQVEKLKDEFVSVVTHELRTPLTAIKGYTQHLIRRLERRSREKRQAANRESLRREPPESYDLRSLQVIQSQSEQLERLVNDLLDLSRVQWGEMNLQYTSFHLADVLTERVQLAQVSAEEHTITLDIQTQDNRIVADRQRVSQVIGNILDNAIRFSPQGRQVSVKLKEENNEYLVSITDQGIGVRPEYMDHIFERFYRVRNTGSRQYAGVGLGLFVARAIIEAHGGHIWVSSNEGLGSTFSFTLPRAPHTTVIQVS